MTAVAGGAMICAAPALASELVVNGGFEQTTNGKGQLGYNTDAVGWTTSGYNFLFTPGSADTTGANGESGSLKLWGPGTGSNNGLTGSSQGGNFVGADGAYKIGSISQTIAGLVEGRNYVVTFDWAAGQQSGFDGATTERWLVSLDDQALSSNIGNYANPTLNAFTQSTEVVNNPNHGFQPWRSASMTFAAQGTTQILSFLAVGTPTGVPPFSLLDNVSLQDAVPEPASWVMMIAGFGLTGAAMRRRKTHATVAA
jgi:hypothetical protein